MSKRTVSLSILPFAVLLALVFQELPVQAQTEKTDSLIRIIGEIPTSPLEILPVSDCRLDEIDEAVFQEYAEQGIPVPSRLKTAISRKKETIDFMRSHIDSLYYIQALQAINQEVPDWNAAMASIDKSLLHNRFFARSVVFKMNYLLKREKNAQACLRYLNRTLQEFASDAKVRGMAQTTYNTLLEQIQQMIDKHLYRDALDLCHMLGRYCQEIFPIRYVPYKEKQLENLAYQGIYRSYYDVAAKAFDQGQNQLAQQYATLAYGFFIEHEKHMAGVNYALELLDKIAVRYLSFAEISDPDEQAYYRTLVQNIVDETGLVVSRNEAYDAEKDIAADLAALNRKDSIPPPSSDSRKFIPLEIPGDPISSRLSPSEARRQYAQAWEQANYYRIKRQFSLAQNWLDIAASLIRKYRIQADPDFVRTYASNAVLAIEQLLNKSEYNLWNSDEDASNKLYAQARLIFIEFQKENPQATSTLTRMQQLLAGFQSKKQDRACQKLQEEIRSKQASFYRQASFGNFEMTRIRLQELQALYKQYELENFSSCPSDTASLAKAQALVGNWHSFKQEIDSALSLWQKKETVREFIQSYTKATETFDSLGLSAFIPAPTTLFSRLSTAKDYETLHAWTELCMENKDWDQAQFLLGFLQGQGYKGEDMEKWSRIFRKATDKEKEER